MSVWLKNREHSGAHDPARSIIETLALHGEHSGAGSGSEAWASGPSSTGVAGRPATAGRSSFSIRGGLQQSHRAGHYSIQGLGDGAGRGEVVRQIGRISLWGSPGCSTGPRCQASGRGTGFMSSGIRWGRWVVITAFNFPVAAFSTLGLMWRPASRRLAQTCRSSRKKYLPRFYT